MQGKRENILVALMKEHGRNYHDSIRIQKFLSVIWCKRFLLGRKSIYVSRYLSNCLLKDCKSLLCICRVEKKEEMRSCESKREKWDSIHTQQFLADL
jgi:hypothetical protein